MDAAQRFLCGDDLFNPLLSMGLQASLILSISHFLQLILIPLGQPSPTSQLLAGMLLGHSFLSSFKVVAAYFFHTSAADYYEVMAFFGRVFIMFLIGLQLDISFLWRNLRSICIIAYAGPLICFIFSGAISYPFYGYFVDQMTLNNKWEHFPTFILVLMLSMANTASPIVFRFVGELNIASSHFGRLVVCSSLVNDVTCLVLGAVVHKTANPKEFNVGTWFGSCFVIFVVSVFLRYLSGWLNGWYQYNKHVKDAQFVAVFFIILFTAGLTEIMGENSVLSSFLLGLTFPREGKTTRTLVSKLSYTVYTFIMPIYLGYNGFQANLRLLGNLKDFVGISMIVVLSTAGKFLGTFVVCQRLNIPARKAVALALFLNLKGHYDMLILTRAKNAADWSNEFYNIMLVTVLIKTLISGIGVAIIVRRNPETFGYNPIPLEQRTPEGELRVLACIYSPRTVPTMIRLIGVLCLSTRHLPITAYMMHLIELLPSKKYPSKMYNQLQDDELSDDETYGGNDLLEISEDVDAFVSETGIFVHQLKAVSPLTRTYDDVCRGAEEVRASIVILPFHKHQRIDGKMENGREGLRTTNQRMLRRAPCTVAILVDRGLVGGLQAALSLQGMRDVAVLFFGGPDDREALAFSKRIGLQVHVNVTVIRFVFVSAGESHERINVSSLVDEEVLMAMPTHGDEDEVDNAFLEEFYNRYVTCGQVGYVEKYVKNGGETATVLREVADLYQLFILGKGSRRNASMTNGISEWEECPELGTVGDLLAAPDFETTSSILIIQQRRPTLD